MKRILSGIQSSGSPHIGNYFGMMKPAIDMQDDGELFLFIADFHALTLTPEPNVLRERIERVALDCIACGLDPAKSVFFRQSDVPEVCELTWVLNCVTNMGLLERAHSYKDKTAKGMVPNSGLFTYPVLMAADILLYKSALVPVGKDQKQHLEITRDIAIKFNQQYGELFPLPEPKISDSVGVIPGTDGQKMSKSYNNTIEIFSDLKQSRKAIMSIKTDSTPMEEPKDPENCNVVALYKLFASEAKVAGMEDRYRAGNYGYGHAKQELFEAYSDYFAPMRKRREELLADMSIVRDILSDGAAKARAVARETLSEVRKTTGLA